MIRRALFLSAAVLAALAALRQTRDGLFAQVPDGPATAPPAAAAPVGQPNSQPAGPLQGIRVDRAKRQVVVDAAVSLQEGPLEFLLCPVGTRDYESLLTTKSKPAALHAALLLLGLSPGKPAQWATPQGGASTQPVFTPPRGAALNISVRWTDAKGVTREVPATDWMSPAGKKGPAPAMKWVFVGSDFLDDGRYWADLEGHSISVSNFASSVVDVPFESTDKNAALEFVANAQAVPPKGTPVELVLTAEKGAEHAAVARITFTVDSFGRIELDGEPLAADKVGETVKKFMASHAQGAATVRLSGSALVFDRERLKGILEEAGLADITFHVQPGLDEALPRTPADEARALAWWKDQFAHAKDLISDPAEDAAAALKSVERKQKEMQAAGVLLEDYARQLRALAEEFKKKAASQPAAAPAPEP